MKDYHKKLSSSHHSSNVTEPTGATHKDSPRKHTPKRNNVTPKREENSFSSGADRRDRHTPKREGFTPKHGSTSGGEQTPKHENHHSSRHSLTPKHERTPRHDHTPRHDLTPKQTLTPKSDVTPVHNLADPTTPSLPSLGISPQHSQSYDFMGSPTAPSNTSSSPLHAPKTPEIATSHFPYESLDTHTSLSDLPGSPGVSQYNSDSEPSRPNTPGDTPLLTYEFSDEIQASIMNIPSISSPGLDHDFTSPRSHSQMKSPDLTSPHRKHQTAPSKVFIFGIYLSLIYKLIDQTF